MPVDWNVLKIGLASQKVSISCWHTKEIRGKLAFQCFFGRGPSSWHRTESGLIKRRARTCALSSFFKDAFSSLSFRAIKCSNLAHSPGDPLLIFRRIPSDDASNGDLNRPESLGCFLLSKWLVWDLTCEVNSLEFHAVQFENVYS